MLLTMAEGPSKKARLDTTQESRYVWLTKVPHFISKSWMEQPSGSDLGQVRIDSADPSNTKVELFLNKTGNEPPKHPLHFDLCMRTDKQQLKVFKETPEGWSIEGTVNGKYDARPKAVTLEYSSIVKKRSQKHLTMRQLDTTKGMAIEELKAKRNAELRPFAVKPTKRGVMFERRAPMERPLLEEKLFGLFEKTPNMKFQELQTATDQPTDYLKKVLNELCVFTKAPPNKHTYSLKPELRSSSSQPTTPP